MFLVLHQSQTFSTQEQFADFQAAVQAAKKLHNERKHNHGYVKTTVVGRDNDKILREYTR